MRFSQFLLLGAVIFIAGSSTFATAENPLQVQNLVTDSNHELADEGRRYLKGNKKSSDDDAVNEERVGATTPSFLQYLNVIKAPKFSKLPVIKQLNWLRKKFGKVLAGRYMERAKKRHDAAMMHYY